MIDVTVAMCQLGAVVICIDDTCKERLFFWTPISPRDTVSEPFGINATAVQADCCTARQDLLFRATDYISAACSCQCRSDGQILGRYGMIIYEARNIGDKRALAGDEASMSYLIASSLSSQIDPGLDLRGKTVW